MSANSKYSWKEIDLLKQNWRNISEELAGNFRSIRTKTAAMLMKFELTLPYSNSTIFITTNEFKPLKISYSFNISNTKNNFLIYPEDITDKIFKLFGLKEVEIGIKKFDSKFILKGNKNIITDLFSKETRDFFIEHLISNFKLESIDKNDILELNIVFNELDKKQMTGLIKNFMSYIDIISNHYLI